MKKILSFFPVLLTASLAIGVLFLFAYPIWFCATQPRYRLIMRDAGNGEVTYRVEGKQGYPTFVYEVLRESTNKAEAVKDYQELKYYDERDERIRRAKWKVVQP